MNVKGNEQKLSHEELVLALIAAQHTIWELNSKLQVSLNEKARLITALNDRSEMEQTLLKANQQIWELNSRLAVCNRERNQLQDKCNRPLRKIIAERVRNKLRRIRNKIGLMR